MASDTSPPKTPQLSFLGDTATPATAAPGASATPAQQAAAGEPVQASGKTGPQPPGSVVDKTDAKPATGPTATSEVSDAKPGTLTLRAPANFKLDGDTEGEIRDIATDLGLDSPKAQRIVDMLARSNGRAAEAFVASKEAEAHAKQQKWFDELTKDAAFGGQNLSASKASIAKALKRFEGGELAKAMDSFGLGSHPALVKFLARVGAALGEDSVSAGATSAQPETPANSEKAWARAVYTKSPGLFAKER